ncbi:hypothetical protein SteCoe_3877 [Stentor coeruleus]|uniref:Uncharacterized protein n=1 Tax=Stentor coeruleus TaxID=5963 RepID=A0A1R2CW26_9CILI|nr:hypothetical protein SteCoe_3877 [Stentor coeruleus]
MSVFKSLSPKKLDFNGVVGGLTLQDIENNLKKSFRGICDNENLSEFLEQAKSSNGKDGFFSVSFERTGKDIEVTEEKPEEAEDGLEIAIAKKEISVLSFRMGVNESPKEKISNSSTFRFGLGPLESIEESTGEDIPYCLDVPSISSHKNLENAHKSQQVSPRLQFIDMDFQRKSKKTRGQVVGKPQGRLGRQNRQKYFKSPYAEVLQISPQRLPAIKNPDKTAKFLKCITLNKRIKGEFNV